MAKFNLEKYKGKTVEIVTLEPSSHSFTVNKGEEGAMLHAGESNADNLVAGEVIEVTDMSVTIQFEKRSRIFTSEIMIHAISSINTSEMTAEGKERAKAASERFKGVQRKKKKGSKE